MKKIQLIFLLVSGCFLVFNSSLKAQSLLKEKIEKQRRADQKERAAK